MDAQCVCPGSFAEPGHAVCISQLLHEAWYAACVSRLFWDSFLSGKRGQAYNPASCHLLVGALGTTFLQINLLQAEQVWPPTLLGS